MRLSGAMIGLLGTVVLAAAPAAAQSADDEAIAVAGSYVDAMRASDFDGMAALMHPVSLAELREIFSPVLASETGPGIISAIGLPPPDQLASMSDSEFFAAFMRAIVAGDSTMADALRQAQADLLGSVPEGDDTVHVVYRMRMKIEGVEVSEMEVLSLGRWENTWRGLLAGDLAGLAAMFQGIAEGNE
jgi:hypothetical protein